jgi:hypothetical protein
VDVVCENRAARKFVDLGRITVSFGNGIGIERKVAGMESNKGTLAGILDITAGVIGCVGAIPLAILAFGGAAVLGMVPEPEANRLAMLPLALFLPLAVFGFVAGLVAIFGGVAALNRRRWGLAVAGAIAAIFGFFPVGIAAVIFTILAEPEFRAAREISEAAESSPPS